MSSSALPGTPRTPVTPATRRMSLSGRLEEIPRTGSSGSPRGGSGTPVGGSRASSLRQGSLGMVDNGVAASSEIQAQMAAQAAEAASKAALEEIERDPIFSSFLDDEFNATSFASQVLSSGSAVQSVRKLSEGIGLLERQLRHEVVLRHSELLQQLASLRDTEAVLAVVRGGADSLQASVQRVRSEIADPYKQVKTKTRQLSALHDSMELLRAVIKVLRQVKKLREHMSPPGGAQPELAKAAQMWAEIEALRREGLVADVAVVDAELAWLQEVGHRIRIEAQKSLEGGMECLNQAEVGSVLQVVYNMGELKVTVDGMMSRYRGQITKAVATALDMKAISASAGLGGLSGGPGGVVRSGTPGLGAAPRAREGLWQRMSACCESVRTILHATWHMQRVLAKKRDPITHVVFLDEVVQPGESLPCEKAWESLVRSLTSQLRASFTASSFVKDTFVTHYPRLLSLLQRMTERVVRDTEVRGVAPAIKPEERHQLVGALEPFQSTYLGQSLTRMLECVNALLPSGAARVPVPPPEAVGRLMGGLEEEVEAVGGDHGLTLLVLKGVNKALLLLAERAEYQVNPSPDARQVSGPATSAEIRNAALCVLLQEVWVRVTAMLPSGSVPAGQRAPAGATRTASVQLPAGSEDVLESGLAAIHGVAADAVTPLFTAMVDRVESCLLLMHDTSFSHDPHPSDPMAAQEAPSRYLEETVKALTHFRAEFLSRMATPLQAASAVATAGAAGEKEPICSALVRRMASRVLLFFVRHASLLRPLSESGKLRLAAEVTEVEFAVSQQLYPVELLGAPYRALRAFRPLLFLETEQLLASTVLQNVPSVIRHLAPNSPNPPPLPPWPPSQDLPPSAVLHHLFTRAPSELESPIQRNQLTPARYSLWLDRHSEEDAWKEVKASLEAYARKVKARGDKEFSPIYPIMGEMGRLLIEGGNKGQKGG